MLFFLEKNGISLKIKTEPLSKVIKDILSELGLFPSAEMKLVQALFRLKLRLRTILHFTLLHL